jgi:hypothetical protein
LSLHLDLHLEVFVPKKEKEIVVVVARGWGVLGLTTNAMKITQQLHS